MFVKVCGLRTESDVVTAVEAGADAVGFVLSASVRQIDPGHARRLAALVPPQVLTVAVVHGIAPSEVAEMALEAGLDVVQLHGDYLRAAFDALADRPFRLWRATTLTPETELRVGAYGEDVLLLDSPVAGSGRPWDLSRLGTANPSGHWLLAGGLTPDTVGAAVAAARPWGVDVSSGVERSRGIKDPALIRAFVTAARAAPPAG